MISQIIACNVFLLYLSFESGIVYLVAVNRILLFRHFLFTLKNNMNDRISFFANEISSKFGNGITFLTCLYLI